MPHPTRLRIADLAQNRATSFDIVPSPAHIAALAAQLDLLGLRKLRLSGQIAGQGRADWVLSARLGATVVQPCVVTLDPVTTRIDADIRRVYVTDYTDPDSPEAEMTEDEAVEPIPAEIDLEQILAEALALHLPQYPRKPEADLGKAVFTEPGKSAMTDEETRPFAGLANLRDQLKS